MIGFYSYRAGNSGSGSGLNHALIGGDGSEERAAGAPGIAAALAHPASAGRRPRRAGERPAYTPWSPA